MRTGNSRGRSGLVASLAAATANAAAVIGVCDEVVTHLRVAVGPRRRVAAG